MVNKGFSRSRPQQVILWIVLVAALLPVAADLPARWSQVSAILPVTALWPDLDAQYRAQLGVVPYDLLRTADALLPRDSAVLLVTSGRDVSRSEYITYHRALYFLAPRPVGWISPAPPDGTWKSRWWVSMPLTAEAIKEKAGMSEAGGGASYILVHGVAEPLNLGPRLAEVGGGYLVGPQGSVAGALPPTVQSAGPFWPLQAAAAVAVIMAIGSAVIITARRFGYSPERFEEPALAWSLGAGVVSVLMLWLNALGLDLEWQMAVITGMATALAAWAVWRIKGGRSRSLEVTGHARSGLPTGIQTAKEQVWTMYIRGLAGLLLVVQVAMVTVMAVGRPLDVWDSWVNWSMKARIIFLDGHISQAVYADPTRAVTHLDYPLLVPLVQSWFYGWLGAPDDRFAGVASVLFYLALAAICFTAMSGAGRTTALAATVIIAAMPYMAGLAALVFAEMPLTLYCTAAGVYMLKWLKEGSRGALALASMAAGLMPWTKKEGIVLLLALGIAILIMHHGVRRAWWGVGAMLLAAGLIAGPWWLFAAYNAIPSPDFLPVTVGTLQSNIGRAGTIARLGLNSLFGSGLSYIWPLTAIGGISICLMQRGRVGKRMEDFFPLAALLFIVTMAASYFFSAFVPYADHILSSIDRLILPVTPLVVIWLALRASAPVDPNGIAGESLYPVLLKP